LKTKRIITQMKRIEKEYFEHIGLQEHELIDNTWFKNCSFYGCDFSDRISFPNERSVIRNTVFEGCTIDNNCGIGNGILESVECINFKTKGILFCLGTLFDRVSFSGKCGNFLLSSHTVDRAIHGGEDLSKKQIKSFNQSANDFYKGIEWALDISKAEFKELELDPSIPAKLVRRNPETQLLILKENIDVERIQQHPHICSLFKRYLRSNQYDQIIVAGTISNKRINEELESIRVLREEGIAELN
jgi:hypothetical protein